MASKKIRETRVEFRKTSELIPYARNSRKHSEEQILQIASSIKEFGFTKPVLIDENSSIIAGHGAVLAALKMGMDEVPTITLPHLSESQKRAYIIADNRIALNSSWDEEMLNIELSDLSDESFNLSVLGFSDQELSKILESEASINDEIDDGIDYQEKFAVLVACDNETDQKEKFEKLQELGYECKLLVN